MDTGRIGESSHSSQRGAGIERIEHTLPDYGVPLLRHLNDDLYSFDIELRECLNGVFYNRPNQRAAVISLFDLKLVDIPGNVTFYQWIPEVPSRPQPLNQLVQFQIAR